MTKMLQKAVERVSQLPEREQDAIACLMLEELKSEEIWEKLFAKNPSVLNRLADEALAEYEKGLTEALDLDAL